MTQPEVLVVGHFPPPVHGAAAMTLALVEWLGARGVRVQRADLAHLGAPHTLARYVAKLGCCSRAAACIVGFRRRGQRRVMIGANAGIGLACTLGLVAIARACGCHTSLHHHSFDYIDRFDWRMWLLCLLGGAGLQHVFLAGSMQQAFFARYRQRAPALVLGNAAFVPARAAQERSRSGLVAGLISNLDAGKGLYVFLDAAERIHAAGLPVQLLLAGPAYAPADRTAIARAAAAGHLQALGPLYDADKQAFFEGIDLFLFPTRYRHEAQPTVIYEAFAAGVPVLAFDRGTIAAQVGDCLPALPREADFAAAALAACEQLLQLDAAGREALRQHARQRHHADAAVAETTLHVLLGELRQASGRSA